MVRKAWSDGVVKLWEGPGGWAVVLYDPISGYPIIRWSISVSKGFL